MKKKFGSRTASVFKRILNIRMWADWDRVKGSTEYLGRGFRKFFVPNSGSRKESFVEAKNRLHLSDSELLEQQKGLLRLSIIMLGIAVCLFVYAIYHLFLLHIFAFLISLIVMMIALVLAFRYHFWYFQIKERKLGCTIKEWFRQGLMGDKR